MGKKSNIKVAENGPYLASNIEILKIVYVKSSHNCIILLLRYWLFYRNMKGLA